MRACLCIMRTAKHKQTQSQCGPTSFSGRRVQVSGAAYRLYDLRLGRVLFDLPPQSGDPDIDRTIERVPGPVMRVFQKLVAVEHPVGMLGKRLEQRELHGGDGDLVAVATEQLVAVEIEHAVAEPGAARSLAVRPGDRLHALA